MVKVVAREFNCMENCYLICAVLFLKGKAKWAANLLTLSVKVYYRA